MATFYSILLRAALMAAGLVFALSLALVVVLATGAWLIGAAWARLTGKRVSPFVMKVNPRKGFEDIYRPQGESRTPRADAVSPLRRDLGVTDVEPRRPGV